MEPITFAPLYMPRVWGGRELERVYRRQLPDPLRPYGESWEIVDRPHEQSQVDEGPYAGMTLHELWTTHRDDIFGPGGETPERFPLLVKVLDARDDLSIQVHPPAHLAAALGGEPKTEMWYVADCDPGARLYVGLKHGVTRASFQQALANGNVAACVHAVEPRPGDSIFIPSGRLHAIGAGFLIHEIQQNSDTTYRVFDWNRPGLDGKPRQLHVRESLASINFDDFEPSMDSPRGDVLAECPYFKTELNNLAAGERIAAPHDRFAILSVVRGQLTSPAGRTFGIGRCLLVPPAAPPLVAAAGTTVLRVTVPAVR